MRIGTHQCTPTCPARIWLERPVEVTRLRAVAAGLIGALVLALLALGLQQLAGQSSGAAHRAQTAAMQAHKAIADFESVSADRRKDNQARLKHDERAAAAARRETLRAAELSRRLAVIAKARADDAARAARGQAVLSAANRAAIMALSAAQRQIRVLQAEQATTIARAVVLECVHGRTFLHKLIVGLAGPHPPPAVHRVLKAVDEQSCTHA